MRREASPWLALPLLLLAAAAAASCGGSDGTTPKIVVHTPDALAAGTAIAADDLARDLGRLYPDLPVERAGLPAPGCQDGVIRVLVLGHEHDERGAAAAAALAPQEIAVDEQRCGAAGHRVVVAGGSHLAAQWAVYDLVERLGVRFLHPEETLYPAAPAWPSAPLAVRERPAFVHRSMHVHRTHPVELSAPLDPTPEMDDHQRRWIDWNVKLRQTEVDGFDVDLVGDYAYRRGFPRSAGFGLLSTQQGGRPIIDPDDPRPESEQLAEAIDEVMAPVPGLPDPQSFGFTFNATEFTVADDVATVERLTFITDYITDTYPGVSIWTINHGTYQEPSPTYGVRFFDLPELAPPALGVKVHTLMFYDLERPAAGIYGNPDFSHLLDWTIEQQAKRRIIHYPESSWWLTFDLPVPLYLAPVTLEARQRDIDLVAPFLAADEGSTSGVYGHHLFTSGQEWGYWLIDYCTARMTWSLDVTWSACIADVTGQLAGGDELAAVLAEVAARQVDDLRDPELLRFLVGSDDETEAAAAAGIVFHPLPPPPAALLDWSDAEIAALESASLVPLELMAADYHAWADRVEALLPLQSEAQAPWVREIADGLRAFALRAEHAVEIYRTAAALRAALALLDFDAVDVAAAGVDRARAFTETARQIIAARELDYRYGAELTVDGDEPGTEGAVENQTIYPYRYLSRTHRLFYWVRPDEQLAALFGGGLELVKVAERILLEGEALDVTLLLPSYDMLQVAWGDGQVDTALAPHGYAAQGVYDWVLDATHAGGVVHHVDRAAVVARRLVFAKGSLTVELPAGAEVVEALLPGFVVGLGVDAAAGGTGAEMLVLGRIDGDSPTVAKGAIYERDRAGSVSGPADLALEIKDIGALVVYGAVITVGDGAGASDRRLSIEGEMDTGEIIALLVSVGGFDLEGAKNLVASVLGYTPETLPARVGFRLGAIGSE